jgi:hypothetical protein
VVAPAPGVLIKKSVDVPGFKVPALPRLRIEECVPDPVAQFIVDPRMNRDGKTLLRTISDLSRYKVANRRFENMF